MTARFILVLTALLCLAPVLVAQSTWLKGSDGSLARTGQATVQFNGRVWSLGGRAPNASAASGTGGSAGFLTSEIWSTQDGTNWTLHAISAPWSAREGLAAVEFNGRLWVIGGGPDVWSSADGISWACEHTSPAFGHRLFHTCVVLNGRVWLMGGLQVGVGWEMNDVWSSSDGANWTLDTGAAPWLARRLHASVAHSGRVWIMGGSTLTTSGVVLLNDVWSSADGANWTQDAAVAAWPARERLSAAALNGRIYVAGGTMLIAGTPLPAADVWSSAGGASWSAETYLASWSARASAGLLTLNSELWLIGGLDGDGVGFTDAWSSPDGDAWTRQAPQTGLHPVRTNNVYRAFNGALWMIGGWSGVAQQSNNDIWRSVDGVNWTCVLEQAPFAARGQHTLEVLNGRMYLMGGEGDTYSWTLPVTIHSDVWSTDDGLNWTLDSGSAWPVAGTSYSGLTQHRSTVHSGKLWVMGGMNGAWQVMGAVWSSPDGATWTLEGSGFPPYIDTRVETMSGEMWAFGGAQSWSSADGATWTLQTSGAAWGSRVCHAVLAHGGRSWLSGGLSGVLMNDLWSTTDGVNWQQETPATTFSPGRLHMGLEELNGEMWMLGGLGNGAWHQDAWRYVENCQPPQITGSAPASAIAGSSYCYSPSLSGTSHLKLTVAGAPSWLESNAVTGELAGTPPMADIGASFDVTLTLSNAFGTAIQSFAITVIGPPPLITSTPTLTAVTGNAYSYAISTAGGPPAPSVQVAGLPAWLTFDPASATITGAPAVADLGQSAPITITASNGTYPDAVQTFQITVVGVAPQFTSTPVTQGQVGVEYSYLVAAVGMPVPTMSVGALPPGLSFDPATGLLSGIPTSAQGGMSSVITITASNGQGPDAVQTFQIDFSGQFSNEGGGADAAGCVAGRVAWLPVVPLLMLLVARRRRRQA